jgi:hypothetical protein
MWNKSYIPPFLTNQGLLSKFQVIEHEVSDLNVHEKSSIKYCSYEVSHHQNMAHRTEFYQI